MRGIILPLISHPSVGRNKHWQPKQRCTSSNTMAIEQGRYFESGDPSPVKKETCQPAMGNWPSTIPGSWRARSRLEMKANRSTL
jgi:hypothetical protein